MSPTVRRVLLYGLLGLAIYAFGRIDGAARQAASQAEQNAYQLLASHTTAHRVDSLATVGRLAKAHADSLAQHPRYVTIITAHHDTVRAVDTVWVNQQVADLNHAYSACSEALALCKAHGDSLAASLRAVLATRTCRVLFFPCPSRTVTFFTGALLGAVVESRLR